MPSPSNFSEPLSSVAPPVSRPAEPVRSDPSRVSEMAIIGKSVIVKGELSGSEDVYVDGVVEGSVTLRGQCLTVGPSGTVRANVEARNVVIHGRVDGNIRASDRVDLRKTASLSGDISTARVAIEDGAYFKGTIDIQKPEIAAKAEPKPAAVPAAAPVANAAATQGVLLEPKKF